MININKMPLRWPSKQLLIASLASIGILSLALLFLLIGQWLPSEMVEKIEIREIAILSTPPPPPPPPTVQQQAVNTPVSLQVQGAGPSLEMIKITQKIDISKPDVPTVTPQQTQWQSLEVDWNAFDLNDLDNLPTLLTPLRITFPKSLSRKGIRQVLIKLDVAINEQGQVTLISIIDNPHPELVTEIQRLVRNSRFTAPQKDNQPVRARFIWPVDIES